MKVLVAGGAGYVGSHCVAELVAAGHDVQVYDNLSAGHRQAIPGVPLTVGELADADLLDRTLAGGFEAVMHFAAHIDVGESVRDPLKYYENNVGNAVRLLRAVQRAGVKRFVFSSTCAVHGPPPSVPIVEDMPTEPASPYGWSKLMVERILADCSGSFGLGFAALRYFNASGAAPDGRNGEDHKPETHLIPIILQVALGQRESVQIYGQDYPTPDGTCIRDYIHVCDLARAHRLAIEKLRPGDVWRCNLGTGRGHSVLEVIEVARRVTGRPIPAKTAPRRPGDPPALYAGVEKAASLLGWHAEITDLEETVRSAWNWHSGHPHGFCER